MTKKIVISDFDIISSLGIGLEENEKNISSQPELSCVKDFDFHSFDEEVKCYKVPSSFDPKEILGKKGLRTKDYSTRLLLSVLELKLKKYFEEADENKRPGIAIGTAFGSVQSIGDFLSDSIVNGVNAVNPQLFANCVINSPTGNANIRYDVKTLSSTVSSGFNAGIDTIIYSSDFIKQGYIDSIIAGGLEEISYYELLGMKRSGILSIKGDAKPFGKDSDALTAGEGVAAFMVETEDNAKEYNHTPVAEIVGYAKGFDPAGGEWNYNPKGEVAKYVVKKALENSGLKPDDIDFIVSSANGIKIGDLMEKNVIEDIFGIDKPVAVYKAKTGEAYGASSALSLALTLIDIKNGKISGCGNYETIEGINIVKEDINKDSKYVLINSFACDGNCTALIIKKV